VVSSSHSRFCAIGTHSCMWRLPRGRTHTHQHTTHTHTHALTHINIQHAHTQEFIACGWKGSATCLTTPTTKWYMEVNLVHGEFTSRMRLSINVHSKGIVRGYDGCVSVISIVDSGNGNAEGCSLTYVVHIFLRRGLVPFTCCHVGQHPNLHL